jgi:hypothetical protein
MAQQYIHARTCFVWERDPVAASAVVLDVAPQQLVLLRRPRSPLHARLVAARRPPHLHGHVRALRCRRTGREVTKSLNPLPRPPARGTDSAAEPRRGRLRQREFL